MALQSKIVPFLWFNNQALEAARLYTSVFNGRIFNESKYKDVGPGEEAGIMVVSFELEGQRFNALNGGPMYQFTEAVSFQISCETQQEVNSYTEKLTAGGGKIVQCGWIKDRFGLSWQVVPTALERLASDPDRTKANRVMQAMMKMKVINIAELERAYRGE